jgi:hypothetical protein
MFCIRNFSPSELTQWDSIGEALEAAEIIPCHPTRCEHFHCAAWQENGVIGSEFFNHLQRPTSRAAELWAVGYRRPGAEHSPPSEFWPTPREFNDNLGMRGAPMTPQELRAAQEAAVEAAAGRQLTPHPHGLSGRITDAHDAKDEQLAVALTSAELSE